MIEPKIHKVISNPYVLGVLIFLAFFVIASLSSNKNNSKTVASFEVIDAEYHNDSAMFLSVSDDNRRYRYFEEFGIVNVYSVDGNFLYQLRFGSLSNGKGAIAIIDGLLYIKTRASIIYVVNEKELIDTAVFSYNDWLHGDRKYQTYEAAMENAALP